MNLKSLIREEIDYFDWVEDVPGDFNIGDKFEYLPSTQSIYPYIVEVTNFVPSINGGIRGINVKVLDLGKNTKSTWDLNNEIYISKRHFSDYLMKPDFMGDLRLKKINESDDMKWIIDQDPNNIHITDLKLGQVVMVNCPKFTSLKNRNLTVNEISYDEESGLCVHFKEMDKIKYPFGTDREPIIPGVYMCERLGCNFKLIKDINESDMKWIQDVKITLGEAWKAGLINEGDILTLSGELADKDDFKRIMVTDFKIKITGAENNFTDSYFIPLDEKWFEYLGYDDDEVRFYRTDKKLEIVDHIKAHENLNESDDLKWMTEIPNSIVVGSCIKSSKGVDWTIEDIQRRFNTVIVKSKKGHKQSWDLTALYIQNREGKLKLCTGETAPPNSIPTPDHLQHPKDVNESNDMKWIEDTNAGLNMDAQWILVNDIDPESIEEGIEIQKYLIDLGYSWGGPDNQELKNYCINAIYHFPDYSGGGKMLYHNGCREAEIHITNKDIKNAAGENTEVIYWSDIKPN